jgi:CelD/BcsL family acetyltransferase involved in cellulose biosynthesis
MSESQPDKLTKAIDDATEAAQESVAAYANLAKEAVTQLAGDAPADAGKWLQLTARSYAQAAADTAKAWTTYNEVLKILAEQTGADSDG